MAVLYVARSAGFSQWTSDIGQSKHVYKVGLTDQPVKEVVAAGFAGFTDWTLVKQQPVPEDQADLTEAQVIERLARKEKMLDPKYFPKIKDTLGLFKVPPEHVTNHILVSRALAGNHDTKELKLKAADFGQYLITNALR